jgi:hypothetical protein
LPDIGGDRFAWCAPLVEGYCVPRSFRAHLEISDFDCVAGLAFSCGWENSVPYEHTVRSRDRFQRPPRNAHRDVPWAKLELIALAWAAVPLPFGLQGWKRRFTIGQIRSAEGDLFGEAFDVVYPQLKPRRRPRVSEQASVRATRIHRSLPDDERLKLREVAQRMHVSEGTAKRYLAEYRKRHPGPERI